MDWLLMCGWIRVLRVTYVLPDLALWRANVQHVSVAEVAEIKSVNQWVR